jgi:hypothetical protein
MSVEELMALLSLVSDKTRMVKIEGCDCINPALGVNETALLDEGVLITADLSVDY